jgi:hypothetical protein
LASTADFRVGHLPAKLVDLRLIGPAGLMELEDPSYEWNHSHK